jgi:PAS domain S-box-containing protein
VGLHLASAEGIILHANQTELALLGYSREEYVGHHITAFHADPAVGDEMLRRLREGETLENEEVTLRARDGSLRHVLISSNVLWEDGQFIHTRCFTRDITLRRNAEEALRRSDRLKDEFLATLAHELRNPLAPIRHSLEILKLAGPASPVSERVRDMLDRQVNHLVRLVDDLMEVSRITRSNIQLRKETIDLRDALRSAVESSRPMIDGSGQSLTIDLPAQSVWVDGDMVRLTQVFTNLLNNASKFTPVGANIWLSVSRRAAGVAVSVRDDGIGIPADMLGSVFDMFTQLNRSAARGQGGLGIGLTLVRRLVEMHGGQVEAHSPGSGAGSEFVVTLPLSEAADTRDPRRDVVRRPALAGRILVVDDNKDAANSLGALLKLLGAEVDIVYDGPTALARLSEFRPSAIILDIGMPGMDGYEVARKIREDSEFHDVMLIAMTGWSQEEDRVRSRSAGFHHHLIKPADIEALQALLIKAGEAKPAPPSPPTSSRHRR